MKTISQKMVMVTKMDTRIYIPQDHLSNFGNRTLDEKLIISKENLTDHI